MPTFRNPTTRELFPSDLGDIWEAARVANVKPGTIRVWETRGKIERVQLDDRRQPLYHLPTVRLAAQVRPGRPKAA
jgi:hypothetical protein